MGIWGDAGEQKQQSKVNVGGGGGGGLSLY